MKEINFKLHDKEIKFTKNDIRKKVNINFEY